jgi:hypothetical protein
MSSQAQQASTTSLVSHFHETREDQSRRALVDAVTRQPDTTMAELAAFVEQHPELSGMTLDELLQRVRRHVARGQQTLTAEAARRVRGHEQAIADIVTRVTRKAERLGLSVERTAIYADKVLDGGGVTVNFRVGAAVGRQALWDYVAMIEPGLPVEVWLTLT